MDSYGAVVGVLCYLAEPPRGHRRTASTQAARSIWGANDLVGCLTLSVAEPGVASVRTALRTAIATAHRQRDRHAVAVYRAALGAIDNAEAVPAESAHRAGAIESSAVGIGRADTPRRALSERNMREIVRRDAAERCSAAQLIEPTRPEAAAQLRADALLLRTLLRGLGAE